MRDFLTLETGQIPNIGTFNGKVPNGSEYQELKKAIESIIVNSCTACDFSLTKKYYSKLFNFENTKTPR
jgi:hypothetical protein